MKSKGDSFDHLVAGLSIDDRVSILQQMKNQIKPEIESLSKESRKEDVVLPRGEILKNESILTRIVLFFKSLFTSKNIEIVYAEHKIALMAKKIDSKYPECFSAQFMSLEQGFYDALLELRNIANSYKDSLAIADEHPGSFLILLGSLIMSDLEKTIDKVANPYSIPFSQEITNDMRLSLIRKMDGVLAEVSISDKSELYTCVQSHIWLNAFSQLPFDSFAAKFTVTSTGSLRCNLSSAVNDLEKFANVLCNSKNIEPEVIEALYLFQMQTKIDSGEQVDVQGGVEGHMAVSLDALKGITNFINKIPLRSITMVARGSTSWVPMYKESGEDWFVHYKAQWKRIFDKKWNHWLHERKTALTKDHVSVFCKTDGFPLFPYRPWVSINTNTFFSKEYTLGFLYKFLTEIFVSYNDVLKIMMVDGDFVLRENKTEFIDTYTEANHLVQSLRDFNDTLSPKGTYGISFAGITSEVLRTVQGQLQFQTLMTTIESEVNLLVLTFGNVCRSFSAVFNGILVASHNPNYDTITNISSLLGPDGAPLRKHIVAVSENIGTALCLLQEIEAVELKGPTNAA